VRGRQFTGGRHPHLAQREHTGLVVLDMQEAFRPIIDGFDGAAANVALLVRGFAILGRPVVATEQYPPGLGHTVEEIASHLPAGTPVVEKTRFSAWGVPAFESALDAAGCRTWVLAGIEAHICVEQTALDMVAQGLEVHVAVDATSSRTPSNRLAGVDKMIASGVHASSAEMALFEMLEEATGPEFKELSRLVR
jgi:nicotinamidase-related amidase